MRFDTKIFYRMPGVVFFLLLVFFYTLPPSGLEGKDECGEGAIKIGEKDGKVECECLPGRFLINKKCVEGQWGDWKRVIEVWPRGATCEEKGGRVIGKTKTDFWERTEEMTPEVGVNCWCKWRACFQETTILCSRQVQEEAYFLDKDGQRTPYRKIRRITLYEELKLKKKTPLSGEATTYGKVHAPMGPNRCFCYPPEGGVESIGGCR